MSKSAKKTTGPKESVQPVKQIPDKENGWSQFEAWAGERYFSCDKGVPLPKGSTP